MDQKLEVLPNIGTGSHGFCMWKDNYVILDSLNGRLLLIDKSTKVPKQIWQVSAVFFNLPLIILQPHCPYSYLL